MDGTSEPQERDWGPFGRPLFDDASSRKLSRVGVVDVGSNSVRLVVFDGAARSPAYFFNEKIMCALGDGVSETGRLNTTGKERAMAAMQRFQRLADGMGLEPLTAVATAAMRDAVDGQAFAEEIEAATGIKVWIIDGAEEARLSAQGVLLGWPGSYGLVCDIGGSSMELAEIEGGKVGKRITSDLGPLKLKALKGGQRGRRAAIKETVAKLAAHMGPQSNRLFLVGGSWRALARIDMNRRGYPLKVQHEYRMRRKDVMETAKFIAASDLEELRQACGVSSGRIVLVPYAVEVLKELLHTFKPHDIAVSSYGIREGMLYEQMPQALRDRDPLIEACRFAEAKDARLPGFGKTLYEFVSPLFKSAPEERKRIIKAACLLHDVSWRAHPDYRADLCFDNATRANLGGLRHSERIYLGLALMYRYRSKLDDSQFAGLLDLLTPEDRLQAEVLGKAMRFGAMLWMSRDTEMGTFKWSPKKKILRLSLNPHSWPLYGEVAQARLQSLASSLEAELSVQLKT
ncbi:Ppx/GppA family phosphatase [Pseudaestuariivita sp.]|uniref:Ppx/GppA family phosphatase n=1 Tax=Pseudaestuariivita sp. TaxID=2211669 RepID=UPI0040595463